MRIIFMGTPEFAVASLASLVEAGHQVCAVFSQPDKPVGRHQNRLKPTPVKEYALSHQIPVHQPTTLRDGTAYEEIKALSPDLIVVAAYGKILPDQILELPPLGCINVHSSLLPKYRGAAPINWAVINGDEETGVTIMYMAHELDAGDIISQIKTPIDRNETVQTLYDRLAVMGGKLLADTIDLMKAGTAGRIPQDPEQVTFAPMLSRDLSPIDWSRSAREIHNQVRGLVPWPATVTNVINGDQIKIFSTAETNEMTQKPAGTVLSADKSGIRIACGDGHVLSVLELQLAGSRRMTVEAFLPGHPVQVG